MTGVQTCALPISSGAGRRSSSGLRRQGECRIDALLWRLTLGARVDINDSIAVKAEYLHLQPFGRMANLLDESAAAAPNGGAYAGDYLTTSLVLKY